MTASLTGLQAIYRKRRDLLSLQATTDQLVTLNSRIVNDNASRAKFAEEAGEGGGGKQKKGGPRP